MHGKDMNYFIALSLFLSIKRVVIYINEASGIGVIKFIQRIPSCAQDVQIYTALNWNQEYR